MAPWQRAALVLLVLLNLIIIVLGLLIITGRLTF